MKLTIGCLILVLFVFQAESKALAHDEHAKKFYAEEKCLEKLDLDRNEVKPLVGKINTPDDNKEVGTFLVCVWKERGILNEDQTVNAERFEDFFLEVFGVYMELSGKNHDMNAENKEKLKSVVELCKDIEGETEEQKAIKLKNCMTQNMYDLELSS